MGTVERDVFASRDLVRAFEHSMQLLAADHDDVCGEIKKMAAAGHANSQDYVDPERLSEAFAMMKETGEKLCVALREAHSAAAQRDVLQDFIEGGFNDLLYDDAPIEAYDVLIRLYDVTRDVIRNSHGEGVARWTDFLAATIERAEMNYESYEALCQMTVSAERQHGVDPERVAPTPASYALRAMLRERPEMASREDAELSPAEADEREARVDALIVDLLEPYADVFRSDAISPDYAWFVRKAIAIHRMHDALPSVQHMVATGPRQVWAKQPVPASELTSANDNAFDPYNNPSLHHRARKTLTSMVNSVCDDGVPDDDAFIAIKHILEKHIKTLEGELRRHRESSTKLPL